MSRRLRTFLATGMIAVLVTPLLAASGAEDPEHPGLPEPPARATEGGIVSQGIAQAARTRQWIRLPRLDLVAYVPSQQTQKDPSCRSFPPYQEVQAWHAYTYVASPAGAPEPYGYSPSFTVRALAFGAVPVEVRLRLEQTRDADGLPEAWELDVPNKTFCPGRGPHAGPTQTEQHTPPASFAGSVSVAVESVRVDGLDLAVASSCRTIAATPLRLSSRDLYSRDPDLRPGEGALDWDPNTARFFNGPGGGLLEGMVDIPAFTGCSTPDDDLDALLTGLVSAKDNPISVRAGQLTTDCLPWRYTEGCFVTSPMPLPVKDD
ncbi:hypothetical protein [Aeromicrobium sp. IC_218]|uniref:hypothetical protein n=1 Tax=Aeromicrobium sp. IC_218 TaxID=2545468 RepID=UPI00103CBD43|nr:hypothetical protein [Aeromicrobium sp. IC_218]TCI98985.1 hypothetical protein E0W78_09590 [Aeromicrobium sp. IC_218]